MIESSLGGLQDVRSRTFLQETDQMETLKETYHA